MLITVPPSRSSTVPLGVPVAGLIGATVMVNVTPCPKTGARVEAVRVVVEFAAAATVRERDGELAVAKLLSPA